MSSSRSKRSSSRPAATSEVFRRVAVVFLGVSLCQAHEPITTKLTWTREISRIFYKRCVICHREGGTAPMSLVTYDEARPWAKAIRDEVLERRMPPWGAVKGFGEFREDPSLSEPEIALIANWVEGGAPKGEDIYLPSPPLFPAGHSAPIVTERTELKGVAPLSEDVAAVGIEPTGPARITARRPDGSIEPLIWIREYRQAQPKVYYFREPVALPKGTRIRVEGAVARLLRE